MPNPGDELLPRKVTLLFHGVVSANGELTLVSKRLTFLYRTMAFGISFPLNTNRTVFATFIISMDPNAPTIGRPQGVDVFGTHGQVPFITGDDETHVFYHETITIQSGSFIKLHLDNTDGFDHTIDAFAELEIQGRPEA